MNTQEELEEAANDFFGSPFIKGQPIPFSEEIVTNEPNLDVKRAMHFIDSLYGMQIVGEPFDEEDRMLLTKALAILSYTKKINTSQGKAICKQLFQ